VIFLVQFGINKHLEIFQRPQIALARILLFFEKIYLFQTALEIMWLPTQTVRYTYTHTKTKQSLKKQTKTNWG